MLTRICNQNTITTVIARSIVIRCDVAISWYTESFCNAER